jgi:cytoskeletal protein CcmA (bactofilin family)
MSHPSAARDVDTAVVDRHTTVSGTLSGQDLVILGSLEGQLTLSGRLHVAAGSRLKARVQAAEVALDGEFEGELRADTLRVAATARASGVFVIGRISIEEGAVLDGDVQSPVDSGAPPALHAVPVAAAEEPAEPEPAEDAAVIAPA